MITCIRRHVSSTTQARVPRAAGAATDLQTRQRAAVFALLAHAGQVVVHPHGSDLRQVPFILVLGPVACSGGTAPGEVTSRHGQRHALTLGKT